MTTKDEKNLSQVTAKIAKIDERVNLALTEKVELTPAGDSDGTLMPAAWYFETIDEAAEKRIAEIVRTATS